MKKGGGSESTIIIGPSKSVLVCAFHSLEYVLGLARFRVFVPNLYYLYHILGKMIIKQKSPAYNKKTTIGPGKKESLEIKDQ